MQFKIKNTRTRQLTICPAAILTANAVSVLIFPFKIINSAKNANNPDLTRNSNVLPAAATETFLTALKYPFKLEFIEATGSIIARILIGTIN